MHRLEDWLNFHEIDPVKLKDILISFQKGASRTPHLWINTENADSTPITNFNFPEVGDALHGAIQPAFGAFLDLQTDLSAIDVRIVHDAAGNAPYTRDRGADAAPEIVLRACESPEDLLILAHEAAHAAQLILSRGSFMPPMAREVCAFLGEIALIEWARKHNPALFPALFDVWLKHDDAYCGADLVALATALEDLRTPYNYRMNYPVARARAVQLFETARPATLAAIFSAGERAMTHLAPDALLRASALPPLPAGDPDNRAIDAYRALGVTALLDFLAENTHAREPIAAAYEAMLGHLQTGTLHVAIDDTRRPVGYACWREQDCGSVEIARRVAPFDGDRLDLALQSRLGTRAGSAQRSDNR